MLPPDEFSTFVEAPTSWSVDLGYIPTEYTIENVNPALVNSSKSIAWKEQPDQGDFLQPVVKLYSQQRADRLGKSIFIVGVLLGISGALAVAAAQTVLD